MKRTKEWWARLEKHERSELVYLEQAHSGPTPYYPDDCVQCGGCGCPSMGGLCPLCGNRLDELIAIANGRPRSPEQMAVLVENDEEEL